MADPMQKINLAEPNPAEGNVNNNQLPQENTQPMSSLESNSTTKKKLNPMVLSISLAVVAGLITGFLVARNRLQNAGVPVAGEKLAANPTDASQIKVGDTFGSADADTFSDHAEGVIQPGGIDGEGSHHLERGSDESQWVYLTSSVVDLDLFVTHEVEIWGETFQGKKAGWLMDVGRLKVNKLNSAEVNNIEVAE